MKNMKLLVSVTWLIIGTLHCSKICGQSMPNSHDSLKHDSLKVVAEFISNANALKDSLTELKYARQKISLLRADSTRLSNLNVSLIVANKQARESAAFFQSRWETVESLFTVRQRKNKLVIVPKGRFKRAFFDFCKVGAGFLFGKIKS